MEIVERVSKATRVMKGLDFLPCGKRLREPVQPGDKKARGFLTNVCKCMKGEYKEDAARLFTAALSDRTRSNGHKLKYRKCCVKHFVRVTEHCHRLSRKLVESSHV